VDTEAIYERYTDELFAQRSKAHLEQIDSFADPKSSATSSDSGESSGDTDSDSSSGEEVSPGPALTASD